MYALEIDEHILNENRLATPGTPPYLGAYHPAVEEIFNKLSPEDQTKLEERAKEWNLTGPTKDIKIR